MQFSTQHSRGFSLSGLFLIFLSLFQIVIGTPVPDSGTVNGTVSAKRDEVPITEEQYINYLRQYYPQTGNYLLYSGGGEDQVKNFKNINPGYFYYDDFYSAERSAHFNTAFPPEGNFGDDSDAASSAIAKVATGTVLVFGAVEYQTKGTASFYATREAMWVKEGRGDGRISAINHMNRDAVSTTDILATEDANGVITYLNGQSGSNASGAFGDCSTTNQPPTCDVPGEE